MNPLAQLHDIHLPESIGWWPPAPGWWILAAIFSTLLAYILYQVSKKRKNSLFRRLALAELQQIQTRPEYQNNAILLLKALSGLLRRVALIISPRTDVAALTEKRWLDYLDKTGDTKEFTQGIGKILSAGPYQKELMERIDQEALLELVHTWIETAGTKN